MSSNDKNQIEKIFCLFHKRTECDCIAPVTENKTLKMRLEHIVSLHTIRNRYESDPEAKEKRAQEIDEFAARLENLQY